jgi:hypothetical protein
MQHYAEKTPAKSSFFATFHRASRLRCAKQNLKCLGWFARAMLLTALLTVCVKAAEAQAPQKWSSAATWGRAVPTAGQNVHIPAGKSILLDVSPPALGNLYIEGTLTFARKNLTLSAANIVVHHGRLLIGTASQPFLQRAVIKLTDTARQDIKVHDHNAGSRVLAVMGGEFSVFAAPRVSWARLSQTARAGTRTLVLDRSVNWAAGNNIVLSPTDFNPFEAEQRRISSVSGNTVTLSSNLRYSHYGEMQYPTGDASQPLDERGEVGLLSRNVTISGGPQDAVRGGHLMFIGASKIQMSGVEVTGMGQRGTLGRYPIHFHHGFDAMNGSFVSNCSIHNNLQRSLVIHRTNGLTISDNVAFNTFGSQFYLEDGIETRNTFRRNLVVLTRFVPNEFRLSLVDGDGRNERQAAFWITNSANTYEGNVAAGVENGFGFWFAGPDHETPDLPLYPEIQPMQPFNDNVAHAIAFREDSVFNLGYGPEQAGTGLFFEVISGYDQEEGYNAPVRGFRASKCLNAAVWDDNYRPLENITSADCRAGFINGQGRMFLMRIQDSMVVARSANNPPTRNIVDYLTFGPFAGPVVFEQGGSEGVALDNVQTIGQFEEPSFG